MLREIKIQNLVIIESADLHWGPGFTAVTGETGAGKSILMGALKFILGAKFKADVIRQGADKLRVEAVFDTPPAKGFRAALERLEIDPEGDEIILERELTPAGKNRCRINGSVVTTAALEEIGAHLVDLHGQHQQQSLIDPATHLGFLDGFAQLESINEQYHARYREWKSLGDELKEAEASARRVREQFDFLKFQAKELEKAPLALGEEERIESELKMQNSMEKITLGLQTSLSILDGEEADILGGIAKLQKEIQALEKCLSPNPFSEYLPSLETARDSLSELRSALRAYRLPQNADAARLDELNAKLSLIQRLKAKYHTDMDGLVTLRDRRLNELASFASSESDIEDLKSKLADAYSKAAIIARELSSKRRAASRAFDQEVNQRLQALAMEGAVFQTRIQTPDTKSDTIVPLTLSGFDTLEFFLASNAGEASKPLKQIASGGEISRIMLAIKSALAQSDPRPLLVFDELDTGIGGVTANRVGEALKELAGHHQLIVITHLHQVAAQASAQQKVVKELEGGRTVTRVLTLSAKERVQELARMMGDDTSQSALKHAKELLSQR
jgi:DNA repair protein RecN (Recombination protein N)